MTAAIEAEDLFKRYGRRTALTSCNLVLPAGRVIGLVGPNGAGKTTLLQLAAGMIAPTSGTIRVLGGSPAHSPRQLSKVGFVAQDTPTYRNMTIADHLRMGARLNLTWDNRVAAQRIEELGLDPSQRTGMLSGGQRAQVALTLAMAKRPDLLILDEPVASLDPLARREFLRSLMAYVAEQGTSVVLSSHLVSDLELVCDYLVVLANARVRLAGPTEDLLTTHHRLVGARRSPGELPANVDVVDASHTERQSTYVVRSRTAIDDPSWSVEQFSLEDLVLTYLAQAAIGAGCDPALKVQR